MAGRTQSRFAACPAKREKGDAIVSDGSEGKEYTRVWTGIGTPLEYCSKNFAPCRIPMMHSTFSAGG